MLTIVHVWLASSFVFGIALAVDQLRRPLSAWKSAGRERRFWVAFTLLMGFHGLGPFGAAAYFTAVIPRFRAADAAPPRPAAQRVGRAIALRRDGRTATESLALVAALLIFASSFIHTAVIADHVGYWVPFGICFAVVTCAQAVWAALIYRAPLNRRILVAGAAGNGALVVVWAISRWVGVPFGPDPWRPEAVGAADVLASLDELVAVILIGVVLAATRHPPSTISGFHVRLATSLAGPLFIWSILAAFGAEHRH